jgi:hypothetical protein
MRLAVKVVTANILCSFLMQSPRNPTYPMLVNLVRFACEFASQKAQTLNLLITRLKLE